jgi:hypothetical protein
LQAGCKVPNPNDRYNYRGAVTSDGTVYYARSALGCGNNVRIYRWSVTAPADPVLINALPDGKDIAGRVFAFNDGSSTTVYFDRLSCRSGASDIYRLDDADTARRSRQPALTHLRTVGLARQRDLLVTQARRDDDDQAREEERDHGRDQPRVAIRPSVVLGPALVHPGRTGPLAAHVSLDLTYLPGAGGEVGGIPGASASWWR